MTAVHVYRTAHATKTDQVTRVYVQAMLVYKLVHIRRAGLKL